VLTDVFRAHAPQLARVNTQHLTAPTPVHDPADPATDPRRSTVPLAPPQPSTRGCGHRDTPGNPRPSSPGSALAKDCGPGVGRPPS
jgi:hypothetical protein